MVMVASVVIRTGFFCTLYCSLAHRAGQKDDAQNQALEAGVNFFKRVEPPTHGNETSTRALQKALGLYRGQILDAVQNWPSVMAHEWMTQTVLPTPLPQDTFVSNSGETSSPQADVQSGRFEAGNSHTDGALLQIHALAPHYSKSNDSAEDSPGIQLNQLILIMVVSATLVLCCGCIGAYWCKKPMRKESLQLKPLSIGQLLEQAQTASEDSDGAPKTKAPVLSDDDSDDDIFDSKAGGETLMPEVPITAPPDEAAPAKVINLSGHLLIVSMSDPATWTPSTRASRMQFVQVRDECLRWWASKEHFQGERDPLGVVDFKMNPCEVTIDPGCAAVVILRPVGGFWVMSSEVLGADLGRPLCFDTSVSEHDSSAWMACLQGQIKNGQAAAASTKVPLWQREFHASYSLHRQIGEGTRGVIFSCIPKGGLDHMAVKIIDRTETPMDAIQKELEIIQSLRHQNIMQIHAAYVERCFVCIVSHKFEASLLGCMRKHWAEKGPIPCTEVVPLQQQILTAINYLHGLKLVLRDIRCEKCLVNKALITDPNCHIVLSGFSNAMLLSDGQRVRQACGSPSYWAPELYALDYAFKVDVWAAGVVIFGMIHGFFAFKNKDAVRTQLPYISTDLPEPCQDFLKQMLEKSEQLRPTAKQLLQHPWMASSREALDEWTAEPPALPEESSQMSKAHTKNFSPARFVYTKWRRSILVERLQNEHRKRASLSVASAASAILSTPRKFFGSPALLSWRNTRSVPVPSSDMHDWCEAAKVEALLQAENAASAITAKDMMGAGNLARALPHTYTIRRMLEEHQIEVENFSKEPPYRFEDLVKAVQSGSFRMMIDASHFKSLVLVVDIVFLRLQPPRYLQSQDAATPENREYLVEFSSSHAADGKLPSSCKRAHENTKTTVKRIIEEKLGMSDCAISWETSGEAAEERYASDLYPGVATVYRTEIIDAVMTATDPSILGRCGLPERVDWRLPEHLMQQGAPRSVFRWVTEDACLLQQIKIGTQGSLFTSGVVHAELGGLTDDTLKKQLRAFGVDVSKFGRTGAKSLRELLAELNSGECVLMQGANSAVLRMVEIVALWLVDKGSGKVMARTRIGESGTLPTDTEDDEAAAKIKKPKNKLLKLFQKKKQDADGESGDTEPKGLPCLPRRPDESLFHTAKRIITEVLGMDEDNIEINPSDIRLGDSEAESEKYPGLRLVYRKHTVIAAYKNGKAPVGNTGRSAATAKATQKLEEPSGQAEETPAKDSNAGEADGSVAAAESKSPAQVSAKDVEEKEETAKPVDTVTSQGAEDTAQDTSSEVVDKEASQGASEKDAEAW